MTLNPYEAPRHPEQPPRPTRRTSGASYRRIGDAVVVTEGASLPHRCVFCNAEVEDGTTGRRYRRTLHYVSPLVYLLLFCNLLILIIVYFATRKPVTVAYSICDHHVRRKRLFGILSVTALLLFVASFGIIETVPYAGLLTGGSILACLVLWVLASRNPTARRWEAPRFWLKGFGSVYLDSLSEEAA